jgi:NADPH2:quinone reductase
MKAWRVHQWGEPETMSFEDVPVPEPAHGQVRIRVRAAALNFFDILQVQGKYQIKPPFPFIPGAEVAGTVDAVGAGAADFQLGQPVVSLTHGGGMAEFVVGPEGRTFRLPKGMDLATASAIPVVYQTSYYALKDRAELRPEEWLLVHAGASGVGISAIQIGRAWGAHVIATAGSEEKLQFAKENGAHHVINYNDATWVDQVKQLTGGRGADVIYDPVGGDVFDESLRCIAFGGRILSIGFTSGRLPVLPVNIALIKGFSVIGVRAGEFGRQFPAKGRENHEAIWKLAEEGQVRPRVDKEYPLAEWRAAFDSLAERKVIGKTIIRPDL